MENRKTGTKNAIVNSVLEIIPDLKEKYKSTKEFQYCKQCGDPCSGETCNACKLMEELNLEWQEAN